MIKKEITMNSQPFHPYKKRLIMGSYILMMVISVLLMITYLWPTIKTIQLYQTTPPILGKVVGYIENTQTSKVLFAEIIHYEIADQSYEIVLDHYRTNPLLLDSSISLWIFNNQNDQAVLYPHLNKEIAISFLSILLFLLSLFSIVFTVKNSSKHQ
jgi:hypothetical protein